MTEQDIIVVAAIGDVIRAKKTWSYWWFGNKDVNYTACMKFLSAEAEKLAKQYHEQQSHSDSYGILLRANHVLSEDYV